MHGGARVMQVRVRSVDLIDPGPLSEQWVVKNCREIGRIAQLVRARP